jgi:protein-S-isoprenylcysteine O-methyltransferase Ste14
MSEHYRHTQTSYYLTAILAISIILVAFGIIPSGSAKATIGILIILAVCVALFSSLTVVVDNRMVKIWFGPRVFRKDFLLKDIKSYRIVKDPWYFGWGIRLIPGGRLYNVAGFYAVELEMKSGMKYRIGTNEPDTLEEVLRESIKSP